MKRKPLIFLALPVAALGMMLISSCKKDLQRTDDRPLNAGVLATGCLDATVDSTITGVINTNLSLSNTKRYKLSGIVYVTAGHTLTIQHGTRILGLAGTSTTPGGGLVITRGARINAVGQADCPIVFTSYRYNDNTVSDSAKSGDWAGVIILGRAPINNPSSGDSARIEGIPNGFPASPYYGGTNDADSSGILKYVRIEYAGYELAVDNEINGLTLGGVGSKTVIDYVAVTESKDDAFEWFGGSVNATHLISINALDDMFDTDNGYNGSITNALGLADPQRADKSQSNGFESDNRADGAVTTRITHPKYKFVTIVGVQTAAAALDSTKGPSGTGRYGRGAQLRRNAEFEITNSIFMGYNFGVSIDTALGSTGPKYRAGTSFIKSSFAHGFGPTPFVLNTTPFVAESNGLPNKGVRFDNAKTWFYTMALAASPANVGIKNANPNASLWLVSPFNRTAVTNFQSSGAASGSGSQINTWALGTTPNKWIQVRW
ncbi:hypothetical protein ACTJJ0_25735 [Chitinophaga sp. 22321]|uniref:Uncharacterized protein n=1 Tax=Chitinophaga hostae TaxID=2831022 RepID=A0ABS5J5C1_9BACT|nr:hypothetical protein [Chitinophaga hostae]MBS0030410.1 hypothetical protein [Chitinophaga hostae]